MSRVEPKIKVGSRVIWSETLSMGGDYGDATMIFSGTVEHMYIGQTYATVVDIKLHSMEFTEGVSWLPELPKHERSVIHLSSLKSLDDLRYKK